MKTFISIIIPIKEINDYLREETIPAILKQTYQNFEIIIITDRPSKERFPQTTIIPSWPKTGPADKRDLGVQKAKGEIMAFLDDDSYPDKNWLQNALAVLNQSPITNHQSLVSAVCGPTLTPPHNSLRQKVSGYVWSTWLGSGGAGTYRCAISSRREVDDYPSVNLLVRKKDFLSVGGFDSHFWPGEDSLPPDEEVLIINQSNKVERVKIGDLVEKNLEESIVHQDGNSEVGYENPENLALFSFDSNYKIRAHPIKAFVRHKKFHPVYELKLSRGNKIKLTASHSLFTLNEDGEIMPVRANSLKPGNLIVTPRKITFSKDIRKINVIQLLLNSEDKFICDEKSALCLISKEYVTFLLKNYKKELSEAINKYSLRGNLQNWKYFGYLPLIALKNLPSESYSFRLLKKFSVEIRVKSRGGVMNMKSIVPLDEDLLWFLGFMCAEGWISNFNKKNKGNRWSLSLNQRMKNRIVLDRSRKILQSHLGLSFSLYKDKRYNTLGIIVNCRALWCFLQALGLGGYSYQKRVPPLIFSLPIKKIRAFLDGYHAGDPCDYTDGRPGKIGITTSSSEMAKDFALLFLRLGEPFRITTHKENRKPHYHDQFNIHAFCPSMEKLGVNTHLRISRNLQDGIPAMDYLLKIARKYHLMSELIANEVSPQYPNQRDNRKKITWYYVRRFINIVKQAVGSVPEVENLEKLLNSNLRFEEILEIKKVKNQPRYAYDLSVGGNPDSDNFIAGTFICAHNTKFCLDLVYKLGGKIIYDPRVLVYHHRREVFKPHLQQIARYALHRGHFARILPKTSLRLGYLIPSLFVLWLFVGPILIYFLSSSLLLLYLLTIGFYFILLLVTGLQIYLKEKNWRLAFLAMASIFVTHLFYGVLFIKGFFSNKLER